MLSILSIFSVHHASIYSSEFCNLRVASGFFRFRANMLIIKVAGWLNRTEHRNTLPPNHRLKLSKVLDFDKNENKKAKT